MSVFEKIEAQQKGHENTDVWMVGEQLKDMLRAEPSLQEIVDKDLDVEGMSLKKAAAKIKAWADKQPRKGNCVCVPPNVAEKIIREFYGLPEAAEKVESVSAAPSEFLSLADFL